MLRPRGRLQVHAGLPRALLLYGGHARWRGHAQVEGDAGRAPARRIADGAQAGRVADGAARIFDDEEPQVVTPFKDHVAPSSGSTPLGDSSFNHRIHLRMSGGPDLNTQPGIKGWREESPVKLYPPTPERE